MAAPRILHVVPHPGGGGETYIRELDALDGFQFDQLALTTDRHLYETPRGLFRLSRAIPDHDLLHIHGDSASLVSLPVIGRLPAVITLNGVHLARRMRGARGWALRRGLRRALERVAAVIGVSEAEVALARELAPGATVELVHNGVPERRAPSEDERRAVREGLDIGPEAVVALFAGELTERKQPIEFAEAAAAARASNPEIVGLVLGQGPLRERLDGMRGEGLRVLGHRSDFGDLVGAADVVVLPSLWEGLAYAVLEGMAQGRAMLVSDGPGNPDAVGDAGLVFPAGDVDAMAASLVLLAGDPELRRSLGDGAARRARERFSVEGMTSATGRIYERALGGESGR